MDKGQKKITFPTFVLMANKVWLILCGIFLTLLIIQSFSLRELKDEKKNLDSEISALKLDRLKTGIELKDLREGRLKRDSLLLINTKHQEDEKIRLLDNAADSVITRIIREYISK